MRDLIKIKENNNMSDLQNITHLTGLMIASDQTLGTNKLNATLNPPCLTAAQIASLINVTPYIVGVNTYTVKPGTVVYNITATCLQVFQLTAVNTYAWVSIGALTGVVAGVKTIAVGDQITINAQGLITAYVRP